jgi:hypothetical protein
VALTYQGVNISTTGGGGGSSSPYIRNFLVADWSGPVSSEYTLSVPESSHGKGTEPTVTLYQTNGANYEQVEAFIQINANGDIAVKVPETIDGRFDGKLIVL